jgi:eukaryotic-like serine/threonine-protein kinase
MSERDLFIGALRITDLAERAQWLDVECGGDASLRRRIDVLLGAYDHAGSLLESPPLDGGPTQDQPVEEQIGAAIGPYKLLEQIGEGGFGVVYLAEQTTPVRRKVALKVLKLGMDTRQVVARFDAERQALAIMDHPNIARVFDGGVTPSGRPFFVMELVKGLPITEFCDQHKLTTQQRLELFVDVCQAVQHAHQKGIIHRDIKPSNVLVSRHDTTPVVKVIDFGVAKALGQELTDKTLFTGIAQMIGTPLYMSPEQAGMSDLDVDTRSDVYSLGVLLYELLTGATPFSKERFKQAAYDEIRRIIREEDPPKPSTRISESTETLPSVAANRGVEPRRLGGLMSGELDWIVMKALEKDRNRRYETANGFAMDVQRYLADEPVQACPPSTVYRFKKFVRRNKGTMVAAGLVLAALVSGVTGTSIGMWRAEHSKREALAEKKRAKEAEAQTLAAFRASTDDAIQQLIGSKPQLGPQEKTYLEKTLQRWQMFADRQGDDEWSLAVRAEGHYRVGVVWQLMGRHEDARKEYEFARDLRKKLIAQYTGVPADRLELANTHNNLGNLLKDLGEHGAARKEFEAALDQLKNLIAQYPDAREIQHGLAQTHVNLGVLLKNLGERGAARKEYETARDLLTTLVAQNPTVPAYQHDLAKTHVNLGFLLRLQADLDPSRSAFDPSRKAYETARNLLRTLVAQNPTDPEYQRDLAKAHSNLGNLLYQIREDDASQKEYEAARDLQKNLVAQYPNVPEFEHGLAGTHNNLGILLNDLGEHNAARKEYETAQAIREKLVEKYPIVVQYQIELGGGYCNIGQLLQRGQPAESLFWYDRAIATLESLHRSDPRHDDAKRFLRISYAGRARSYAALKKHAEALNDWDKAVELALPAARAEFRALRANAKLHAGLFVEAVAEVIDLTKSSKWSFGQLYDFACVYSVASSKIADKRKEYADRAMELLHQAVKAGYKNAAHMKKDPDLKSLHDRDDFKQLIADLEAKTK